MAFKFGTKHIIPFLVATTIAGCTNSFSLDVRDQFGGILDTTSAAATAVAERPEPDARGVITFATYQVVLARTGDRMAMSLHALALMQIGWADLMASQRTRFCAMAK